MCCTSRGASPVAPPVRSVAVRTTALLLRMAAMSYACARSQRSRLKVGLAAGSISSMATPFSMCSAASADRKGDRSFPGRQAAQESRLPPPPRRAAHQGQSPY
jgi:hypothetical protein